MVIDNASEDGTPELVRSEFPWVTLLQSNTNLGYGAAANRAIETSRGRFVLLLNPDMELRNVAELPHVLRQAERTEGFGVFGCTLVYGDGSLQSSGERFPSLASIAATYLGFSHLWRRWSRVRSGFYEVDWLSGAFMLVRRAVFEQVGLFSPHFFMYGEDLEFCARAKRAGWRIGVFGDYVVTHFHSRGAQKSLARMLVHSARGTMRNVAALHGGSLSFSRRLLLRFILSMGAILRGLARLPHHPRIAMEFLAAGTQILKGPEAD
jgi:GT2 family glycosyltransferase